MPGSSPGVVHKYFRPDGAKRFKADTSRIFASRNNTDLIAIDQTLKDYLLLPEADHAARTAALLVLILRIETWQKAKERKIAHGSSFRNPFVADLLHGAQDEMKRLRPKANWNKLRSAVGKIVPKGSAHGAPSGGLKHLQSDIDPATGTGAVNNWLEVLDKEHRRGQELSRHFKQWLGSGETCSFWDYLDRLPTAAKDELDKVSVHYLGNPLMRALFEVHVDHGRLYSRMTPVVQAFIVSGRDKKIIFDQAEYKALDTTAWPSAAMRNFENGWACFVLAPNNVIYAGVHAGGIFHHSSFLAGAPVLAAGMIRVENGVVRGIHEKNGHYRSQTVHMKAFLRLLMSKLPHVNWRNVEYHEFNGFRTNVADVMGIATAPPPLPPRVTAPVAPPIPSRVAPPVLPRTGPTGPARNGGPPPRPGMIPLPGLARGPAVPPPRPPRRTGQP